MRESKPSLDTRLPASKEQERSNMRLIKIVLLSLTALLVTAAAANADIIRLDTAYDGSPLALNDTFSVDVYLDCECAGAGSGDPSDYLIVQFDLTFDDPVLSYAIASSSPTGAPPVNGGTSEPGVEVFGNQGKAGGLIILGGTPSSAYYSASGGPHQSDSSSPDDTVLLLYTSKQLGNGIGSSAGGEWFLGNLVFQVDATGSSTTISLREAIGEAFVIAFEDGSLFDLNDITLQGDNINVLTVPEPTLAGGSIAVLLALYGVHARRRRS
jgi:hypothetical protein